MSEAKLPTREEITQLPLRAQIAFAARCARRVFPKFEQSWLSAPEQHITAVARAVEFAEFVAVSSVGAPMSFNSIVLSAFAAAREVAPNSAPAPFVVDSRSRVARFAAEAAAEAARSTGITDRANSQFVFNAMQQANAIAPDVTTTAIAMDYQCLRELAIAENWTDDTPVPPKIFGPLWPDGPPAGWPVETSGSEEIVFEIEVPPGTPTEVAAAFVRNLLTQADDLDRALGGHGLMVESVDVYGDDSSIGRGRVAS